MEELFVQRILANAHILLKLLIFTWLFVIKFFISKLGMYSFHINIKYKRLLLLNLNKNYKLNTIIEYK